SPQQNHKNRLARNPQDCSPRSRRLTALRENGAAVFFAPKFSNGNFSSPRSSAGTAANPAPTTNRLHPRKRSASAHTTLRDLLASDAIRSGLHRADLFARGDRKPLPALHILR